MSHMLDLTPASAFHTSHPPAGTNSTAPPPIAVGQLHGAVLAPHPRSRASQRTTPWPQHRAGTRGHAPTNRWPVQYCQIQASNPTLSSPATAVWANHHANLRLPIPSKPQSRATTTASAPKSHPRTATTVPRSLCNRHTDHHGVERAAARVCAPHSGCGGEGCVAATRAGGRRPRCCLPCR